MKTKRRLQLKKKISKKYILIYIIKVEQGLSTPLNTNQFLLTKHRSLENTPETIGQCPGSLLDQLLEEESLNEPEPDQWTQPIIR